MASTKKRITRKIKYGLKEFKRDLEKERGPLTFGRLLESHRKCEGLTQNGLGRMVGLSGTNICDLEKGRKIPSAKRAYDLAEALGMSQKQWVEVALQDALRKQEIDLKVSIA